MQFYARKREEAGEELGKKRLNAVLFPIFQNLQIWNEHLHEKWTSRAGIVLCQKACEIQMYMRNRPAKL